MSDVRDDDSWVSGAWKAYRAHMVDLAFRMLGDLGDAEDIVIDAFSRLANADPASIENQRAWLTVVTSRLCLDRLRSPRSRREHVHDFLAGDPAGGPTLTSSEPNPADRATLDDSIGLALLMVMRSLAPGERVVFVLHDVFQVPYGEISETVGRPAATCRQLVRRARQKIEADSGGRRPDITASEHRALTERFLAACANGDINGLVKVLDPDVAGDVDLGAGAPASGVVHGAEQVGANLLDFWRTATLVSLPIDRRPALLAFRKRSLAGVLSLTPTRDGARIAKVHVIADPAKLAVVRDQLAGSVG